MIDTKELRENAERVSATNLKLHGFSEVDYFPPQTILALCDEVERLRDALDQIAFPQGTEVHGGSHPISAVDAQLIARAALSHTGVECSCPPPLARVDGKIVETPRNADCPVHGA